MPYNQSSCRTIVNKGDYYDDFAVVKMPTPVAYYYRKHAKFREIEYHREVGYDGICESRRVLRTREAKDGFNYIAKTVMDSLSNADFVNISVDGNLVRSERDVYKLLRLRRKDIVEVNHEPKKREICIITTK
ncbi:MAG: hypothetical protein U0K71_02045 [Paludibacteraceae bacterium]|nr:hypothetical protein [Paludibacteraceae bacterium]MDO4523770.1 hypothetical protein [Bacteroidales bacterium]MEE0083517.1 hypothetical protein [Paludibacteraceae bacterium]MEE1175771.1 hypothetical protein [Paludibacteraceae bacterium]